MEADAGSVHGIMPASPRGSFETLGRHAAMPEQNPSLTWSTASSLKELGELTAQWVEGTLPSHWTQDAPPDPETGDIGSILASLNRSGFVTEFSQPGESPEKGFGQRAAVSGFCDPVAALALAALGVHTDLVVFAYPPGASGGYQLPITVEDYHPFTWCGSFDPDLCSDQSGTLGKEAQQALLDSWYVAVIDPCWGRKDYLWALVLQALQGEHTPYSAQPSSSHPCGRDFVY